VAALAVAFLAAGAVGPVLRPAPDGGDARGRAAQAEPRGTWPVTRGAAPGYVPDAACAECHAQHAESYDHVGMARSFYRPEKERAIEDFDAAPFYHAASDRYYAMEWRGDELVQRRWRVDGRGERYAEVERRVDWIVGSGKNGRTYLYQTELGELFQLPLLWYGKSRAWGMAPGYDRPRHDGFTRQVKRECLFCHNAYPDVPAGSDEPGRSQRFPAELPEGIGCQRCHGPGARHVALAEDVDAAEEEVAAAITNPARLDRERRDDVCNQCHLQPSSAIKSYVRRFGRGDYAFLPGESLTDFHLPVDFDEGRGPSARFEINHHPYRLYQSRCWTESDGELSCLTCHDPHRVVAPADRARHYRAACTGCHALDECDVEAMGAQGAEATDDCTVCHMPRHRTEDVIQAAMTDHLIRREPAPDDWLAPRAEVERIHVADVATYWPERTPAGREGAVLEALAAVSLGDGSALPRLERELDGRGVDAVQPYLVLGDALLAAGRPADAASAFERAVERSPDLASAHARRGSALAGAGRERAARRAFRRALELEPDDPDAHRRFAEALLAWGRSAGARLHLERSLALRAALPDVLALLARLARRSGDAPRAAEHLRAAIALEPREVERYDLLADALLEAGRRAEALEALHHGRAAAPDDVRFPRRLALEALLAAGPRDREGAAAARELARSAVAVDPHDGVAKLVLALCEVQAGDAAAARAALEAADATGIDGGLRALAEVPVLVAEERHAEARARLASAPASAPASTPASTPASRPSESRSAAAGAALRERLRAHARAALPPP